MNDFYDQLSPFYHLIYPDWETSIAQQAQQLRNIIYSQWGKTFQSILDVSCGIGTQGLGLAALGFQVTGSDISEEAVRRATREAQTRHLDISWSVCDMRQVHTHHGSNFDIVLSGDNAIPHLLNDDEIQLALKAMYTCLRVGGGCIITMRDYDQVERGKTILKPYGIREKNGKRYLVWQVWDFEGEQYHLSLYLLEDDHQSTTATTHVMRSQYYAVSPNHLLRLMEQTGFIEVKRIDDVFFQPVLVGTKPPTHIQ